MQSARLPDNESERLLALHEYQVLDTPEEEAFNELAELAAIICEAPIALVSLVDSSRQWFKARVGLEAQQTARSVSFCAHAILQPGLFVVPDTHKDKRFADNPLVTGAPHIRFYAGAPLFTAEGYGLGTLCVIDRKPRELDAQQEKALLVLRTHLLKLLELRQRSREQAELHRELETFTYMVSHDLRAPLRAINGFTSALREDYAGSLDAEADALLQRIQQNATRMDDLAQSILYLSRIDRAELNIRYVNLSALAHKVVKELQKRAPRDNITLSIQPDMLVMGDEGLLRILLESLLGNAWKFTASRGAAHIEFACEKIAGKKTFFVRDNGVGFEMAYANRLFIPFQRLHTEEEYEGIGLGLAAVKRILNRLGGSITYEAYPDKGATFRFSLPGDNLSSQQA